MLRSLKAWAMRAPENSSRHYLMQWAGEAGALGCDRSFRVLDAGAGSAPYREVFRHVGYETADLTAYKKGYGDIDHVCDLADMPMDSGQYDLVFCSQTLEHIKNPIQVLREFHRVLKPGGQAWLSAPFFYEEHEQPFDFYRYTQYAWRHMATEAGFTVKNIEWLEGYYGTVAYQMHMAARNLSKEHLIWRLLLLHFSRRLASRDLREKVTDRGMCKNYRIQLVKPTDQTACAR
jgi:SAM-dependent methyltransferase